MGVGKLLSEEGLDRSMHGTLARETRLKLQSFAEFRINCVRRSANEAAHIIARISCMETSSMAWFHVLPVSILSVLQTNCNNLSLIN